MISPILSAWAAPQAKEVVFNINIDRSVRNSLAFYSDDDRLVIHILNNGNVPEQIIDGTTGQAWVGTLADLYKLRRVYEYDSISEPSDSYLSRMGCREWAVCTGLEGTTFVAMARPGKLRHQLQFRVLQFKELFMELEMAFSGRSLEAPASLSAVEIAALEEVSRTGWLIRYRDALRSIETTEKIQTLERSGWLPLLRSTPILEHKQADGYPLQRDIELAMCRAAVIPVTATLIRGEPGSGRAMSTAINRCNSLPSKYHFFIHVVDWMLATPRDAWPVMSRRIREESAGSEDSESLTKFLASGSTKSGDSVAELTASAQKSEPKPKAKVPPPNVSTVRVNDMSDRAPQVDAFAELAAINAVPNQIVLLSFTERGGLVQPDASSLSGTVFRASVEGDDIERGAFRIEALNSLKSAIRMAAGRYRVKLRVKLFVARVDRCVHRVYCLTRTSETRSSKNLIEVAEFSLRPDNAHRDTKVVRFGPLKPTAEGDESSIYQSQLSEVRLVIELDGRISPQ